MKNLPNEQVIALEKAFRKERKSGISKQALGNWVTRYKRLGLLGLKDKLQPGNHHKLTKLQKRSIKQLITTQTPSQLGLTGQFWSTETLKALVQVKFNVKFQSKESYRQLFHYCGFSFHKPKKVNQRQSEYMRVRFEETLKKDLRTGLVEKIKWSW